MVPKKREQEKCQKTELRGEKLSEACVARRTCYCRGFVAAHRKIIKAIPQRMWVELLRDGEGIWPGGHKFLYLGSLMQEHPSTLH